MTAKNAIATSAFAEPSASAARALSRSCPDSPRACRRIHTTMNVTIPIAAIADDGLQPFLLALRQLLVEHLEQHADGGADHDRGGDPEPHRAQGVAPSLLAQEAGDDADDERGLDPLPEADHITGQHELGQPKPTR